MRAMNRALLWLLVVAACHPTANTRSPEPVRGLAPSQLSQALTDPSVGVIFGKGGPVLLPLQRHGKVELWLPGPGPGRRLVLEVEVRDPALSKAEGQPSLTLMMASAAAARALGTDPARFHWRAQLGDGGQLPLWASAQIAAGLVAALAGWPITRPRAVVLGAIGPDGSLVAVPGMTDLTARWSAAGAVVGLPAGSRAEVQTRIRNAGATARELPSLAAAVALLTGREPPATEVAAAAALAAPAAERARWREPFESSRAALALRWHQVLVLDGAPHVPVAVRDLAERAVLAAGLAERLFAQGEFEAALVAQVNATARAAAAIDALALVEAVRLGRFVEAEAEGSRLANAEDEAAALVAELARRGQGAAVASSDELALAIEAWALAPALQGAARAWSLEVHEVKGRERSELGTSATAARLAANAVPLALHAAQARASLELARLLAGRARSDGPGELERVGALPAGLDQAGHWLLMLEVGVGRARERDEATLIAAAAGFPATSSALADLPAAQAHWARFVLRSVGAAAGWRVLAARVRGAGEVEGALGLPQAAQAAATAAHAAQLATGSVPHATRFWYAAGRAFAAAGASADAAGAYARARAASELALAVLRVKISGRADAPAAPRR